MLSMNPQQLRIKVSCHAVLRFQQRFRLYFPYGNQTPYVTVKRLVSNGRVCTLWESVPFYKNKINSTHGQVTVIHSAPCFFVCTIENNRLVVKTVLDKWVCEPKRK